MSQKIEMCVKQLTAFLQQFHGLCKSFVVLRTFFLNGLLFYRPESHASRGPEPRWTKIVYNTSLS